ncbi:hypothetical protein M427DRAFT_61177 [Gonapodya prolifera JEL478]|uniref:Uncharacterized protein n=1 Tax=Gonapodya prolifera (strain JEL478) TaxID=1344416 RepID=A0A139A2U2_GONPJ|nr:hypothetical protein M427DRAFT_61177 [Gonapodya prolifera JEL478]|eukprot:KXS11092.1 hypothetical protein M427DRAFT_61177 [Gonapodya prolifera JEL478]
MATSGQPHAHTRDTPLAQPAHDNGHPYAYASTHPTTHVPRPTLPSLRDMQVPMPPLPPPPAHQQHPIHTPPLFPHKSNYAPVLWDSTYAVPLQGFAQPVAAPPALPQSVALTDSAYAPPMPMQHLPLPRNTSSASPHLSTASPHASPIPLSSPHTSPAPLPSPPLHGESTPLASSSSSTTILPIPSFPTPAAPLASTAPPPQQQQSCKQPVSTETILAACKRNYELCFIENVAWDEEHGADADADGDTHVDGGSPGIGPPSAPPSPHPDTTKRKRSSTQRILDSSGPPTPSTSTSSSSPPLHPTHTSLLVPAPTPLPARRGSNVLSLLNAPPASLLLTPAPSVSGASTPKSVSEPPSPPRKRVCTKSLAPADLPSSTSTSGPAPAPATSEVDTATIAATLAPPTSWGMTRSTLDAQLRLRLGRLVMMEMSEDEGDGGGESPGVRTGVGV